MVTKARFVGYGLVLLLVLVGITIPGMAQQQEKVAVIVQAAAAVPSSQLGVLQSYAAQRCAIISGARICTQGELMYAQRATGTYIGSAVTLDGMRKIASALGTDHVVVLRIIRWEEDLSFKPERSLVLLGAGSLLGGSLQMLTSPLGLLAGLDKEATVGLLATVFDGRGNIEFTTAVTACDHPLFSLLTADPVVAAKEAIEKALYQVAVAL
jgi:hypothetical protein